MAKALYNAPSYVNSSVVGKLLLERIRQNPEDIYYTTLFYQWGTKFNELVTVDLIKETLSLLLVEELPISKWGYVNLCLIVLRSEWAAYEKFEEWFAVFQILIDNIDYSDLYIQETQSVLERIMWTPKEAERIVEALLQKRLDK